MVNKVAYLTKPKVFEICEEEPPELSDDEVLVEIKHVGICGSDLLFYNDPTVGGELDTKLPIILGHECAGIVVKIGSNVQSIQVGDKVALEPGISCGKCSYCLEGRYNLCEKVNFMAAPPFKAGALKRYVSHPASFTYKLPDHMTTMEGALIEPLAVGIHASDRGMAAPGKSVLIMGAGCIGLMTLMACVAKGVTDITVTDLFDNRLEMAMKLGASKVINGSREEITSSSRYDIIFETAGSSSTVAMTPNLIRRGGKLVMVGNVHTNVLYDFNTLNQKEADIISVFRYANIYHQAIQLVAGGRIPVREVVSNIYPFNEVNQAFDFAFNKKMASLKVVLEF
ncbi:putative chlorophyll synthesis pathway protein BchC [Clostridiales bacterium 1_7_47FAA]|uniref:NAD(P)-dependent alcohol dehydrogenase n=1 Tax=Enterocloster hominis (ex Hitch et al. 2024) TaxID=1917870 RepID=A0ABV1DF63_9FIRM|nr:putative chlorophyll synthesis pathway protein BchC [Clostridiales bacterium 1_7_47FAA]